MQAALGFRTHSGWAAVVAVTAESDLPAIVGRWEIDLCNASISGSKQPYHTAEPMPLSQAAAFLHRCTVATDGLAVRALQTIGTELKARGFSLVGCGLLTGSGRTLPPLERILASHAVIHAAEGEFYRDAIVRAGKELRLPLTRVREKDAYAQAAKLLALAPERIVVRIAKVGRAVGAPWAQDQKLAALAAWVSLSCQQHPLASALIARRSA
jgi:hypothetical protein